MTPRILYIQYANPGSYPPLQHSSHILADDGWSVRFLGVEMEGAADLELASHSRITVKRIPRVSKGWRQKLNFAKYAEWVSQQTWRWSPHWVYVSDPLAAPLGLIVSLFGVPVVYHEHDSPSEHKVENGSPFMRTIFWAREKLGRRAELCILPNEQRAMYFDQQVGRSGSTYCVWNCLSQKEVPSKNHIYSCDSEDIYLHYHGSIVPSRLPVTVVEALTQLPEFVHLRVMGYDPAGGDHVEMLQSHAAKFGVNNRLHILGTVPTRAKLLMQAQESHIGLSLMPREPADVNMQNMSGASNKPFDYLATGMPLLVSDLPDWRSIFVEPGYGRSCNPDSPKSIAEAIQWYIDHPSKRREMGKAGHRRVIEDWNYEKQFAQVKRSLESII